VRDDLVHPTILRNQARIDRISLGKQTAVAKVAYARAMCPSAARCAGVVSRATANQVHLFLHTTAFRPISMNDGAPVEMSRAELYQPRPGRPVMPSS